MGQLSPSLGAVFFRKLIAALMSHQSRNGIAVACDARSCFALASRESAR